MSNGNRNWIASISLLPSLQWLPIPLKTQLPTKKKEKNPTKSLPVLVSFLIHTTFCLLNATTVTCSSCYFSNIQSFFFSTSGYSYLLILLSEKLSSRSLHSLLPDCIQVSAHLSPPQRKLSDAPPLTFCPLTLFNFSSHYLSFVLYVHIVYIYVHLLITHIWL